MDLKEVFKGIGNQMLNDFQHINEQIKHVGERGGEREVTVMRFLASYLPSKYGVANGEIVDSQGQTSRQCDIVIYDHANSPLLLTGANYRVFPAESVYAVIEVKSSLRATALAEAAENIRSVKALKRDNGPIAGVVFAYRSGRGSEPMDSIAEQLQRLNRELHPVEYIDLIGVLDSGIVALINYEGMVQIPENLEQRVMQAYEELAIPILLWFFMHFLELLSGQMSQLPDYHRYISGGTGGYEIGLVRVYELTTE